MKKTFKIAILNKNIFKIVAHPISWYWLVGFFLWMVHNVFVLNRKVNIDKERQISKRFNAISRLYPEGTYISHR